MNLQSSGLTSETKAYSAEQSSRGLSQEHPTRRDFFKGVALPVLALGVASCRPTDPTQIVYEHARRVPLDIQSDVNLKVVSLKEFLELATTRGMIGAVEEYENESSGLFTYRFLPTGSKEWHYVRGVSAGAERGQIIDVLSQNSVSINGRYFSTQQPIPTSCFGYVLYTAGLAAAIGALVAVGTRVKERLTNRFEQDNSAQNSENQRTRERFEDVGGNRELVAEMKELVRDIESYKKGNQIKLPRGILLGGDPGLGKTFIARVLAGEADCIFLSYSAASLQSSPYKGMWVREIDKLFSSARAARDGGAVAKFSSLKHRSLGKLKGQSNSPSPKREVVIIFIDEFDSVGRARSTDNHGINSEGEHDKAVNALLAQMDGVDQELNEGIIVIGATNFPGKLDPALVRPGRFDLEFRLLPAATFAERLDVLTKSAKRVFESGGISIDNPAYLENIARITGGESNAHLRGILIKAKDLAVRRKGAVVTEAELFEAFQRQKFGPPIDSLAPAAEKKLVAYHEHGHGIIGHLCDLRPLVISMVPRGETLGRVLLDSEFLTEPPLTRRSLLRAILVNAGGRAGELIYGGEDSTTNGVTQDLATMRSISRMLLASGMLGIQPSIDIMKSHDRDLPDDVTRVMAAVQTSAIETARNVLGVFRREQIGQLVESSLAGNAELVGTAANSFYQVLNGTTEEVKAKQLIEEFLATPLKSVQ